MNGDARPQPILFGRSSSSFTRVARIWAAELEVRYEFRILRDLTSLNVDEYGGNPALRIPTFHTSRGTWFGALNICRELTRMSQRQRRVIWPEHLDTAVAADAQELATQSMATAVALIMEQMTTAAETSRPSKARQSLLNMLAWLDEHVNAAMAALPADRDLSFLEVTLFCLVAHLEFRNVLGGIEHPRLQAFCRSFERRESAQRTSYRFDFA